MKYPPIEDVLAFYDKARDVRNRLYTEHELSSDEDEEGITSEEGEMEKKKTRRRRYIVADLTMHPSALAALSSGLGPAGNAEITGEGRSRSHGMSERYEKSTSKGSSGSNGSSSSSSSSSSNNRGGQQHNHVNARNSPLPLPLPLPSTVKGAVTHLFGRGGEGGGGIQRGRGIGTGLFPSVPSLPSPSSLGRGWGVSEGKKGATRNKSSGSGSSTANAALTSNMGTGEARAELSALRALNRRMSEKIGAIAGLLEERLVRGMDDKSEGNRERENDKATALNAVAQLKQLRDVLLGRLKEDDCFWGDEE